MMTKVEWQEAKGMLEKFSSDFHLEYQNFRSPENPVTKFTAKEGFENTMAHCLSFVKSNVEIHELLAGKPDPTGMYLINIDNDFKSLGHFVYYKDELNRKIEDKIRSFA